MAKNKNITPANVTEWLASTGFLFPSNEIELSRFNKLYGELDEKLTGKEIDPERILKGLTPSKVVKLNIATSIEDQFSSFKMVARNGGNLPIHILEKMKKNQENSKSNDSTLPEENDK